MNSTRKLVLLALFVSQALVLSIIESRIPVPVSIHGVKLGLANIITLIVIVFFGFKEATAVVFVRCILSSIFVGQGMSYFLFSITGGILSTIVMWMLYRMKSNSLSNIGISLAGAVSHNIGQIAVATLIMRDLDVIAYLPVLIVSGCVTGVFVGLVASFLEKGLRKANIFS